MGAGGRPQPRHDFNPRSREGSDDLLFRIRLINLNFNPRSREGSDFPTFSATSVISHFNPRSREGSDLYGDDEIQGSDPFQSTLP